MKKITSLLSILIIATITFGQKIELRIPIGHTNPVAAVSISPDEKYAATAGTDRSMKIWSIADGREIKSLQMAETARYQVKFMADSRHITVRLENGWEYWDALDGKKGYEFLDPATDLDSKKSFAISTDGTKICVADNSTVEIKNAADGTLSDSFNWTVKEETIANFNQIRFNESYLACNNKQNLSIYNLKTKSKIQIELPDGVTNSMDLAPDNNELYVNARNHVYKINLDTKKITIIQDFGASEGSNFSSDGKYYIAADLNLINRSTNEQVKHFYLNGLYASTASSSYFICFSMYTGNGELYSMKTFEKIKDFSNETAWLQKMTVNYKTNELVFTTDLKEARFWNLKNFNFEKT